MTITPQNMITAPPAIVARELDRRTNDGIDVRLLWNPQTDRVSVAIDDDRSGESFHFEVSAADALEAFRHPYAYAATHRPFGIRAGRGKVR